MDGDGLVERSVLRNSMAVLNDSANYQCISVVQGIETADNITIFVYGMCQLSLTFNYIAYSNHICLRTYYIPYSFA